MSMRFAMRRIELRLFLTTTVCVLLLTSIAVADDPSEIVLWPDGVPEPVVRTEPAETLVKGDDGLTRRFKKRIKGDILLFQRGSSLWPQG